MYHWVETKTVGLGIYKKIGLIKMQNEDLGDGSRFCYDTNKTMTTRTLSSCRQTLSQHICSWLLAHSSRLLSTQVAVDAVVIENCKL